AAGIHVITGLAALKIHAKVALVVRRTAGRTRRYAHVGSGNYNPDTARLYTDVGLFTAHDGINEELHALFNELTGSRARRRRHSAGCSSRPPTCWTGSWPSSLVRRHTREPAAAGAFARSSTVSPTAR